MKLHIKSNKQAVGRAAASIAERELRSALNNRGEANLILATGASQVEMLEQLTRRDIDWRQVTCFHLDEYLGMAETHPASFRRYLKQRFCDRIVAATKGFRILVIPRSRQAQEESALSNVEGRESRD